MYNPGEWGADTAEATSAPNSHSLGSPLGQGRDRNSPFWSSNHFKLENK